MSLTKRIVGLVALALAPALAIQGYNEYALRTARAEAVRGEALRTASGVAAELGQFGRGARQVLAILSEAPPIRGRDPRTCTAYLKTLLGKVPGAFLLAVADADGVIACNTLGSEAGSYAVTERRYFREAKRDGFGVGEYVVGKVTGKPTFQFAHAIRSPEGRFDGIVLASVDLAWLAARLEHAGMPAGANLTVADRNGTILVRLPDHARWVGKAVPAAFAAALARGGVAELPDPEGDTRVTGIATAATDDLDSVTVSVGLSPATAFADIDAATRRGLVLLGLGALLAVAAALLAGRALIRRPVRRLLRAAMAWRSGDLGARSGLTGSTEFGQLGEAFDAMAAALQAHEGELREEIARSHRLQAQQTTMLHELNHRVRNTLATVQSLARQSRRDEDGGRLEGRIISLSRTHDLLSRDDWSGATLMAVLENEIAPYRDRGSDPFRLDGPDLDLAPRCVLALGMTLHELATNAGKYGALSVEGGRVEVAWRLDAGGQGTRRLALEWRESGGPAVTPPTRQGFGMRLINGGVRRELDGTVRLDFAPAGLRCTLDVPIDGPDRFTTFRQEPASVPEHAA